MFLSNLKRRLSTGSIVNGLRGITTSQNFLAVITIVTMVIAIRLPIDYKRIMEAADGDFGVHIYAALDMLNGRPVAPFTLAHSLYQLILIFIWWLSRCQIDFWQSAIGLQVLSSFASAIIVYFWLGNSTGKSHIWKRVFLSISLVIVAPVIITVLLDHEYYYGYIVLANYHNPTVHLSRPLALINFIAAVEVLKDKRYSAWLYLVIFCVTASATFLKPNYTIILLPSVGLMTFFRLVRGRSINWTMGLISLCLPAMLILVPQYIFTYLNRGSDEGIAFLPFIVAQVNSKYLIIKYLLSVFFPLIIVIHCFKAAIKNNEMILAWIAFGIGSLQYYLLGEKGYRLDHGNFSWGLQIALFVLFVVTIRFLFQYAQSSQKQSIYRSLIPIGAYLPHVISGIVYYVYCYITPHYR